MDQMTEPGGAAERLRRQKETAERLEGLSARLARVLLTRKAPNPAIQGPGYDLYVKAAAALWAEAMTDPAKVMTRQTEFLNRSAEAWRQAMTGEAAEPGKDKRFSDPAWTENPYFNYVMRQYQVSADAVTRAVEEIDTLPPAEKRRLGYFTQQIVDMMAPANFLGTNPEALSRAVETEGDSLIRGLENLIGDLEANDGELLVRLVDESAFEVGGNIATAPGQVVFRNRLIEILQYEPATETVHETPLLIFPPWINKFYILDLKEKNSLVRWLTAQGHSVFMVSWVNPDRSYAETGLGDYIEEGMLAAIAEVRRICGTKTVNAVGYCIAGTVLSITLALLKQRRQAPVNAATLLTALTDFSDQGEFTPFLQDDFLDGIEAVIERKGMLPAPVMARTFSFLRSSDLVYGPAVRNYLMGEAPPAFDLLYWNGDSTNLPGRMAQEYLRALFRGNDFARGELQLLGKTLGLAEVSVPVFAVAAETDHIAPWKDCHRGVSQMGSPDKTFVLAQSGHIAGMVNPPERKKYGYYTNADLGAGQTAWRDQAQHHPGSWWPLWAEWLAKRSGKQVPARVPEDKGLGKAPGSYVLEKAK